MACELKTGYLLLVTRSSQNMPIFSKLSVTALVCNSVPDWICVSAYMPCMMARVLKHPKNNPRGKKSQEKKPNHNNKQETNPKTPQEKTYLFFWPVLFPALAHCYYYKAGRKRTDCGSAAWTSLMSLKIASWIVFSALV